MADLKQNVMDALRTVNDPDLKRDLVSLGMIKQCEVDGNGNVSVTVELTTPACPLKELIKKDCETAIGRVPGIGKIAVSMTANVSRANVPQGKIALDGVRNIIAVGSGKGGVGKSTTAVNLAVALKELGAKVAILDADIYGPNVPGMLGASGRPKVINNRMIPIVSQGIAIMSMGFLVTEDTPLVWRGPMLHGVLKQLLTDVSWGQQDYLVIDLPPGTGDVQLSLAQMVPVTGAVIVTTPQNVALQDVKKGITMFQKVSIPILGIVENMSYYLCPKCGNRDEIFSHGGGGETAVANGTDLLGEIPLNQRLREGMDTGKPLAGDTSSPYYEIYRNLAQAVAQKVAILNAGAPEKAAAASS